LKQLEKNYKRIVIKIGSSLFYSDKKKLDFRVLGNLIEQVAALTKENTEIVLVSSGAIALGMSVLNLQARPKKLSYLQAIAAVGQNELMDKYRDLLKEKNMHCAQVLLTWEDFDDRSRYLNAKNTILTLLKLGSIPVINENDTIAVDEIKFGDNDTLSALVSVQLKADLLVLLSDIDGLFTGDPSNPESKLLTFVSSVTPDIEKLVSEKHGSFGGMGTKLNAAKLVTEAGIPMVIANGNIEGVLGRLISGERIGTTFSARSANAQQ